MPNGVDSGANRPQPLTFGYDEAPLMRASAQWLVAAAGGVAAALLAGAQLGAVGTLAGRPLLLFFALIALIVAVAASGWVIYAASRVLVVSRVTPSDLTRIEAVTQARERGINVQAATKEEQALAKLLEEISVHRGWLLPHSFQTFDDLYQAYEIARRQGASADVQMTLHEHLAAACGFVRNELTRQRYATLTRVLIRRAGPLCVLGVTALITILNWPSPDVVQITAPLRLDVIFKGSTTELREAGLVDACKGRRVPAVALAGDLEEPIVVLTTEGPCPPTRFKLTPRIGLAVPVPK